MANGKQQFEILSNAHSREQLLEHAKNNGISWEEHKDPAINWMRASSRITRHLDDGKDFDTDPIDKETVRTMLDHYKAIREHHKKTMIPHLRSAVAKLHAEKGDPNGDPMDLIHEAHDHLNSNGGTVWSDKVHTLHHLNNQIKNLTVKLTKVK